MKARGSDIERYRCRDAEIRGDRYKQQVEELKETITALERELADIKLINHQLEVDVQERDNLIDKLDADLARVRECAKELIEYHEDEISEYGEAPCLCKHIENLQQALKETGDEND